MTDWLKVALVINLCALAVALLTGSVLAWNSRGSQNVALATGTLFAAVLLFAIQILFELRSTSERHMLNSEYTVDKAARSIRQWKYPDTLAWRLTDEVTASSALAQRRVNLFTEEARQLAQDMALYSMVVMLFREEFDWQLERTKLGGPNSGLITTVQMTSPVDECEIFTSEQFSKLLEASGNVFATFLQGLTSKTLCLPPRSEVRIERSKIRLTNPYYDLTIGIKPSGATSFMKPNSVGEAPTLPSGEPQYETHLNGLEIVAKYKALRSQHGDMPKYKAWVGRLIRSSRAWFEGDA